MNFEFEYATADHMTVDCIPEVVFWTGNENITNPSVSPQQGQAPDGMKSSQTRSAGPGPWSLGGKRT